MGQTAILEDVDGAQLARSRSRARRLRIVLVAFIIGAWFVGHRCCHGSMSQATVCPQTEALVPTQNHELWSDISALISADSFEKHAAELLGGAVRVRYVCFLDVPLSAL